MRLAKIAATCAFVSLFGVFGIAVLGSTLAAGISAGSFTSGLHLALYDCIGLKVVLGIAVYVLLRAGLDKLGRPSTSRFAKGETLRSG